MARKCCLLLLTILLLVLIAQASENGVHSAVFHSPKIALGAGSVVNKFYDEIDFPRGHIAVKEFRAELVDVLGKPVPVRETYVHHWTVSRYYTLRNGSGDLTNSRRCEYYCEQYFGSGSESRGTHGYVPDPYGIVVGNPADVPEGYAERWYLNVHAIDTRGVVDKLGCIECGCDHYNVTVEESGGAFCCYDEAQCRLRDGFLSIKRSLFMRYTVKWVDWVDTIVPVRIYVLELSDTAKIAVTATERRSQAEHKDEPCTLSGVSGSGCLHTKRTSIAMTKGGYFVYGVGHQYPGGIGSTLYGEDGRKICSSMAIYGEGKETGNEAGYIIGMSSCYPQSGTVKISNGESVIFETTYNSSLWHSGVLGNFYILLADEAASVTRWFSFSPARPSFSDSTKLRLHKYSWGLVLVAMAIAAVAGISYRRRNEIDEEEYKAMYYEHAAIA